MRTRNECNRSFRQTTHGEQQHDQTPGAMFLATINSHTDECGNLPRVEKVRRSASGKLSVTDRLRTKEQVLAAVLRCVDGHLTAFEHDDYSARLIVLDADASESHTAWVEMLNPGTVATPGLEVLGD